MNKKGFTLIELLAVIVILAAIAIITVPTILGVIERARKGAAESSALGYIDAIEKQIALDSVEGIIHQDKDDYVYDEIEVSVKGTTPTGGLYTLNSNKVTAGTFCINNYIVEYSENKVKASTKCTGEDLKLVGSVKLSKSSTNISYPNTDTFEVIENTSGGNLTCETSDSSVATCSIKDKVVTVKSGKKEGNATLTIKSEGSSKYKEATAAFVVVTAKGLISYTSNGYEGVYDGEEHGITVTSTNGIIKYGIEEGNYTLEQSPKYSDVGEYIVYYSITNEGYKEVTGSKTIKITKANGEIKLDKTSGSVGYNETLEINIEKNVSGSAIEAVSSNSDMASVQVEGNKVIVKGLETGKVVITITSKATKNYKETSVTYDLTITKANNKLKLSSNTGSYTYPESGTFEVIENTSGGALSCTTSNKNIATCSITNNTVTVKTGTTKGVATLTIKSEATTNYNEGQVAYVVTTSPGLISYTANGYSGTYDGKTHGISVEASGATIKYGTTSGTYDLDASPTRTDVGTTTVYYQITREGYNDITGSKDIVISKAEGSVIAPTAKTLTYNGSAQNLINAGSSTTGEIQYKIEGGSYSTSIPTGTSAGTYKVYYKVVGDKNHNDTAEASIDVTINKAKLTYSANGYSGTYDGKTHGISVEASGATIKYGEASGTYNQDTSPTYSDVGNYTVYYQITREGYITVESSETVTITKANNPLKLSENAGTVTYPTAKTVTISGNTSGGTLSCSSSNTAAATCSISGSTLTIKPGTTEASSVTITVKSAATTNYNEGQVAYVAVTANGLMSVTANGYTGVYDGKAHGISVEASGATIKYGTTSGTYDLSASPTRTNAGTTKVYYQVTKAGYKTVTGSKDIVISKADNPIRVTAKTGLTYTGSAQTLATVSGAQGNVCYSTSSAPTSCTSAGTISTGTNAGSYTVYYYVAGNTNYKAKSGSVSVTIAKKADTISLTAKTYTYDGSGKTATISATSGLTPSVTYYSNSSCSTTVSGNPTNAGTYYAKATTAGNTNYKAGSLGCTKAVIINKASNPLKLSENAGTVTYPTSKTVTISGNTSGGALSCTSSNTAAATCSISGSTLTIKPGTTEASSVTITVKSAATTNYNEAQVAYVATSKLGTLSVTANGYSGYYDGKAHGITVEASGATIKYGTASGTYNLTSSPTYTDVGTYTVYYQVTKAGYKTVTGSKIVEIKGKLLYDTVKSLASSATINFSVRSGVSGTNGIYITNNTDSGKAVYYYRGNVNNNIIFNNMCWKIIRTTETGGVKLIYNGTPSNGTCTATGVNSQVGTSAFNPYADDNAYVGYMYGTAGSTTYAQTHVNTNNSTIKIYIDDWYSKNFTSSATSKLEDTVFCNDRSMVAGGNNNTLASTYGKLGYGQNLTGYGALARSAYQTKIPKPSLKCANANDKFTVNTANGNGKLTYPVGLITLDEIVYAGFNTHDSNTNDYKDTNNYLYTGSNYLSLSPVVVCGFTNIAYAAVGYVLSDGSVGNSIAFDANGVRPVVSLAPGTLTSSGNGSSSNPYVVE